MRKYLAFVAAAAIVGCSDGAQHGTLVTGPASFSAYTFTDRTVQLNLSSTFNDCTGEIITFNGPISIVFHVTVDGAGGFHLNGTAAFQGVTAVGASSGTTYHLVGRSVRGFDGPLNITAGGAFVYVHEITQLWVSEGPADDVFITTRYTFIFDANGTLTVATVVARAECQS